MPIDYWPQSAGRRPRPIPGRVAFGGTLGVAATANVKKVEEERTLVARKDLLALRQQGKKNGKPVDESTQRRIEPRLIGLEQRLQKVLKTRGLCASSWHGES